MSSHDSTPGARASIVVRDQIRRVACEFYGATTVETPIEGFVNLTRTGIDDPLAGVRAATAARDTATAEMRHYAELTRGAGRSWDEVAEALGIRQADFDEPREELAFGLVAENRPLPFRDRFQRFDSWWECRSCGKRVRDHGPFDGHPANNESGHDVSCRRHAAEIAAHRIEDF